MIDSETKSKNKAETMGMDNGESTNIYVNLQIKESRML